MYATEDLRTCRGCNGRNVSMKLTITRVSNSRLFSLLENIRDRVGVQFESSRGMKMSQAWHCKPEPEVMNRFTYYSSSIKQPETYYS
jgi:hypothetical protein